MKKTILLAGALMSMMGVVTAHADSISELPSGEYSLDQTHSSVIWSVNHMGLTSYTARFSAFDATLQLDSENIENSKIKATVDVVSIDTGYPLADENDFDKELSDNENWFNSAKFPHITFESERLEQTGDNVGRMHGKITMLGVTKPATFDVTLNGAMSEHLLTGNAVLGVTAKTIVKRSDWGMDVALGLVGDEVEIVIQAEFMQE